MRERAAFGLNENTKALGKEIDLRRVAGRKSPRRKIGLQMFAISFQDCGSIEGGIEGDTEQARAGELWIGLNCFLELRKIIRDARTKIRDRTASENEGQNVGMPAQAFGGKARAILIRQRKERNNLAFL